MCIQARTGPSAEGFAAQDHCGIAALLSSRPWTWNSPLLSSRPRPSGPHAVPRSQSAADGPRMGGRREQRTRKGNTGHAACRDSDAAKPLEISSKDSGRIGRAQKAAPGAAGRACPIHNSKHPRRECESARCNRGVSDGLQALVKPITFTSRNALHGKQCAAAITRAE